MRVTHVITRLIVGGAQENTIASVLGLRKNPGFEVDLISGPTHGPEGSLESVLQTAAQSSAHPVLTILPELVRPVHPWKDWVALRKLGARFRATKPELVHTHSGKAGLVGRLAAARAGVPVVVHTIHGPSFGPFQGPLANLAFRQAERRAGKVTNHFVVVADAMKSQYLQAGIGSPEQYTRIFSGFALEPFLQARNSPELRARLGLRPEHVVIGKIARLFKLKGHQALFVIAPDLIRDCPNIRFLFVGGGEWRERFEAQARELGLAGHFIFTGLVAPGEVAQYVGVMDIVAHLSEREGLARALPQALAAARPVVAFDCDGAGEVCLNDQTGFLVAPGDTATLKRRLLELSNSPELRQRFGAAGRSFVKERFSVETMVEELAALYLRLARR